MMSIVNEAYINALLADATYALDGDIGAGLTGNELVFELKDRLTLTQAQYLGEHFTVVTHVESSDVFDSGFDATVWRNNATGQTYVSMQGTTGLADFTTDIDLTLSGLAKEQIVDMVNWWLKNSTTAGNSAQQILLVAGVFSWAPPVIGTGVLSDTTSVTVNGHSLGGHLATAFSRLFGGELNIEHTYTYNSAGFNPLSEMFFDNIELFLTSTSTGSFPTNSEQSNFFAENGLSITTQNLFNGQVGQRIALFNEESSNPISNHYQYKLTDSLALGSVINVLDSSFGFVQLNSLFDKGSNKPEASLEKILDVLGTLLYGSTLPATSISDDSDSAARISYHNNLFSLKGLIFTDANALIPTLKPEYQNLHFVEVNSLASAAQSDSAAGYAYRYALENLNPFAIIGTSDLYTSHNSNGELNAENLLTSDELLRQAA